MIIICIAALASFAVFGEVSLVGTCPAEDSSSALRIVWHSDSPSCEVRCGPAGRKAAPFPVVQTRSIARDEEAVFGTRRGRI